MSQQSIASCSREQETEIHRCIEGQPLLDRTTCQAQNCFPEIRRHRQSGINLRGTRLGQFEIMSLRSGIHFHHDKAFLDLGSVGIDKRSTFRFCPFTDLKREDAVIFFDGYDFKRTV